MQQYHHLPQLKDDSALVVKLKLLHAAGLLMRPSNMQLLLLKARKLSEKILTVI
jgi:hypothetical protein